MEKKKREFTLSELSHDLFTRTSLPDLKKEVIGWHQAGCQVERDLGTLDALVEDLRGKSQRENTGEDATLVGDGPVKGRPLSELLKVLRANRWRLQTIRDGETMYSYAYFCKYTSMDDVSLPAFTANLQELQRDGVLDVICWAALRMSETQSTVHRLTDFMGQIQSHLKMTEEGTSELSKRLVELSAGVIGVQSANRRALQRTCENVCWQVSGSGKSQNQSLKDLVISMSKMHQSLDGHFSKSNKISESNAETLVNIEGHLSAMSDGIKKLVEHQTSAKKEESKDASVPEGQKRVDPTMGPAAATAKAVAGAQLGTAAMAPKAMPLQPGEGVGSSPANPVSVPSPANPVSVPGPTGPAGNMPPGPPPQMDPNLMGMAMPSSWAC